MKHTTCRLMTHRVLPVFAISLFFALAVLPSTTDAACNTGRCPVGDYSNDDSTVEVTITFAVTPEEAGYIEVDGKELESDSIELWQGDSVVLEAIASKGYEFAGWSGSLTSTENPLETPFYNHKNLTANFVKSEEQEPTDESVLVISVPDGTSALDEEDHELSEVSAHLQAPHDIPADMLIIGDVYDIEPDGATFDPSLPIVLPFNPALLPDGVKNSQLRIAFFDDESSAWLELPSVVDEDDMTVTAEVTHLSEFGIMVPKPEGVIALTAPGFSIGSPVIMPSTPQVGDTITVSVVARYGGDAVEATSPVTLILNDEVLEEKAVTLGQGESTAVTFTLLAQAESTCEIAVNGMTGTFSVAPATTPQALADAVRLAEKEDSPGFMSRLFDRISLPAISGIDIKGDWKLLALIVGVVGVPLVGFILPALRRQVLRYRYDI